MLVSGRADSRAGGEFGRLGRAIVGRLFVAFVAVGLVGCGEDPVSVEFEVIEEITFAPSLNIDLAAMERRSTGVYFQDLIPGGGEEVVFGTTPTVTFTGWLANGTEFDSGTFSFFMGGGRVIGGLEDGLLNARAGGTRLIIVPPNRGYGGQVLTGPTGQVIVPAGSVLVFEVTVDGVG